MSGVVSPDETGTSSASVWDLLFWRCFLSVWVDIKYESRPCVVGLLKITFWFSISFSAKAIKSQSKFIASDFEIWL